MARNGRAALALMAGVAAVALPAFGQQSPQSILPPGFDTPLQPAPPAKPAAAPPTQTAPIDGVPTLALTPPDADTVIDSAVPDAQAQADALAAAEALRKQDIPEQARRPVDHIGILSADVTGVPEDGYGGTSGRYLATLMNRLDAPIASRWLSMLLRRTLTTDIVTPPGIDPADWTAARARLLVRMGEADAARLLVTRIDPDRATPAMDAAILDAALAAADPGALCPVADLAETAAPAPAWPLARAMCAGLSGESGTASALIDRARGMPGGARGLDLQLAERIVGAGGSAKRSPNIEWQGVNDITPWRFGLASALGFAAPANLLDGGGLAMKAWAARAPMLPLADRLGAMRTAATLGTMSSADLVDAYAMAAEDGDPRAMDKTPTGLLRTAYVAADPADRMTALRALWAQPTDERDQYAGRLLTARAAERILPSADVGGDAAALIQAMLSAGLDIQAARWAAIAKGLSGAAGEESWALLAVGAPSAVMGVDADLIAGFGDGGRGSARLRAQFLFASLAGLGRIDAAATNDLAQRLGVPVAARNVWTQAIDGAATRRETASVALLAAVGMQTSDWTQVTPAFLYHIVADLRAVGYEPEARMIAAEALSRT